MTEPTPSRLPPDALHAERALAGCITVDNANTVAATLRAIHFDPATMLDPLWTDVVGHALTHDAPHDPISVAAALPQHPDALDRLADVMRDCCWSPGSVETYASVIADAHRHRVTIEASARVIDACYDRADPTLHIRRLVELWPHEPGAVL